MSLLNRLTPGKFNPLRKLNLESLQVHSRRRLRVAALVRSGRTFMEGRGRCNVGDRILREGTNQQIRVLNLNRRPNINSRPRSPLYPPPPPGLWPLASLSRSSVCPSICPVHTVFLVSLTRPSSVLRYSQCRTYTTDTPDLWHRLAPKRYLRATFGETKQRESG